jgi:hypothetical protein
MMKKYRFWKMMVAVLALLLALIACDFGTPTPNPQKNARVACTQATVKGVTSAGAWDCSQGTHSLTISNLPADVTPYYVAFDDAALRTQNKEKSIEAIISIVADIRFLNANSEVVTTFKDPVQLWMGYDAADIAELRKSDRSVTQLIPIVIMPDKDNIWKTFPAESVDFSKIQDASNPGVTITFNTWGDPPAGWGVPPRY